MWKLFSGRTTAETKSPKLSLFDTSGMKVREWYVCYFPRLPYLWFIHFWKQGFRHVELARPIQCGPGVDDVVWLQVVPTFEMIDIELCIDPRPPWVKCPGIIVQKVTSVVKPASIRSWFDIGPPSCVEAAKMALSIKAFWVRTPWQLYKYISKRNGVILRDR
jgi:hypothetical protein